MSDHIPGWHPEPPPLTQITRPPTTAELIERARRAIEDSRPTLEETRRVLRLAEEQRAAIRGQE